MAEKERGNTILKVVLFILLIVVVGLIVTIAVINIKPKDDNEVGKSEQELVDEGFTILNNEGVEAADKYYDEYINSAKSSEEKIMYLKARIRSYDVGCGFGCKDQIIADIHQIAELANGDMSIINDLCTYQEGYLDKNPIDGCDYDPNEVYNGE